VQQTIIHCAEHCLSASKTVQYFCCTVQTRYCTEIAQQQKEEDNTISETEKIAQYLNADQAADYLRELASKIGAEEFAVIRNLEYIYSPNEIYPLAPKASAPLPYIAAFAVDMDGTSTTTEPLALHSLEYMVRRFTNRLSTDEWQGLDEEKDLPFVIGNSNFKHTEFLVKRYANEIKLNALRDSFIEAVVWTLANMDDPQRIRDVRLNVTNTGLSAILDDPRIKSISTMTDEETVELAKALAKDYGDFFKCETQSELVSAALDIYYKRYHSILKHIEQGEGSELSKQLLGENNRRLIEPMPGYAVFIALIKGWLDEEAAELYSILIKDAERTKADKLPDEAEGRRRLANIAKRFRSHPAKIALVTASIAYETHAVVKEVFNVMREQVSDWPISKEKRNEIRSRMEDYLQVYDGFVNATDSSEARLKPHRDLYAIALYQMSIPKQEYSMCIGVEDTEPGIISLRAAGIGFAVALPNHDTRRQNYCAASHIIKGGLPEMILKHNLFLADI